MTPTDSTPSTPSNPSTPATALTEASRQALVLAALRSVLRPAARLMMDNDVQLASVVEVLKQALVSEAVRSGGPSRVNDTRISVMTGVHRKDVKRLMTTGDDTGLADASSMMSVGSQVVGLWLSDARFLGPDGQPCALARTPRYANDQSPNFAELAQRVSTDVGPRAVLDGLIQLGVVVEVDEENVALRQQAFVPTQSLKDSLHFLAANVSDHFASAIHNQRRVADQPALLEQSAFSQNLSDAQAQALHRSARAWWERALKQFLRDATLAEAESTSAAQPTYRVRFGVYFYQATHDDQPLLPLPKRLA